MAIHNFYNSLVASLPRCCLEGADGFSLNLSDKKGRIRGLQDHSRLGSAFRAGPPKIQGRECHPGRPRLPSDYQVCPYLHQKHKVYPKDLRQTQIMKLVSVPEGINMTWQLALNALYGWQVVIREIYGATEGMFGQQRDEKRVCRRPVVSRRYCRATRSVT